MSRRLILILWLLGLSSLGAAASAAPHGPIVPRGLWLCDRAQGPMTCRDMRPGAADLNRPDAVLVLAVDLAPEAIQPDRPLMVELTAIAASEVRWNGVLLGRNGRPGVDAAHEVPGELDGLFVAPAGLARPGRNLITARVSSHYQWLPVASPLHGFRVGVYEDPVRIGLMYYLPVLAMVGLLGLAAVYFAVLALLDRRHSGSALLAAIAAAAVAQILVETARVFFTYPYPWHLARLAGVAGLSSLTAVLVAAWAAGRFAPRWRIWAPALALGGCAIALVFGSGFDGKALSAAQVGLVALLACAALGVRDRAPMARPAVVAALAILAVSLVQDAAFLDSGYYLSLAVVFAALVAAQASSLWRARREGQAQAERAGALEESLNQAARSARPVVIKDGARTHRIAPADIRFVKGADDYCEVHLADGRVLMSDMTLAQLAAALPDGFVRIHKSYIVNVDQVRTLGPKPSGGRAVLLTDGTALPVGRTYAEAVRRWSSVA